MPWTRGVLTHNDVGSLLLAAADAGLLDNLANPDFLQEEWRAITAHAPESARSDLIEFGNRAIACGCTNMIGPQLALLRRRRDG
jgi:hypothetical protein